MKTSFKSKMAFLFILIGLSFSCKKNDTIPADSTYVDSTETAVDSVDATVDTTSAIVDTATVKRDTATKTKK
ncbi:hypothetical protein NJT12_22960 [Flavobacterium sp. AC]|uniref:Uncharacterized protein n=1 Tax=Flavobacterium azizsancarii TaxID=2961580 RepID=A0ABT4WIW3_9FLAO|nr:hypothetical protein [Flavobacterium azizsancarii]MDA6072487.1 hypothetical protein [Flavobacterium azizsancarii]